MLRLLASRLLKKRLLAAWKAARKDGKMNVGVESQKAAVSREIMPADGSNPAQRNGRGFRHVPAYDRQTSRQLISHRRTWQRVRIAVIFPNIGERLSGRSARLPLPKSTTRADETGQGLFLFYNPPSLRENLERRADAPLRASKGQKALPKGVLFGD